MFYAAATSYFPYAFVQPTNFLVSQTSTPPVRHVVHHHVRHHTNEYEEQKPIEPPMKKIVEHHYYHHHHHRSLTPPPRVSRKVPTDAELDTRLETIRDELRRSYAGKRDQSTETVDYYHPPRRSPSPITYKQHFDAPKPAIRPRSRSRSLPRTPRLSREPWRSSNQNDYAWRDAHLPAYRSFSTSKRVSSAPQDHLFYSDVQKTTGNCIHIVPKCQCEREPPYLKILNAPVTYLH